MVRNHFVSSMSAIPKLVPMVAVLLGFLSTDAFGDLGTEPAGPFSFVNETSEDVEIKFITVILEDGRTQRVNNEAKWVEAGYSLSTEPNGNQRFVMRAISFRLRTKDGAETYGSADSRNFDKNGRIVVKFTEESLKRHLELAEQRRNSHGPLYFRNETSLPILITIKSLEDGEKKAGQLDIGLECDPGADGMLKSDRDRLVVVSKITFALAVKYEGMDRKTIMERDYNLSTWTTEYNATTGVTGVVITQDLLRRHFAIVSRKNAAEGGRLDRQLLEQQQRIDRLESEIQRENERQRSQDLARRTPAPSSPALVPPAVRNSRAVATAPSNANEAGLTRGEKIFVGGALTVFSLFGGGGYQVVKGLKEAHSSGSLYPSPGTEFVYQERLRSCKVCGGSGKQDFNTRTCRRCGGSGLHDEWGYDPK